MGIAGPTRTDGTVMNHFEVLLRSAKALGRLDNSGTEGEACAILASIIEAEMCCYVAIRLFDKETEELRLTWETKAHEFISTLFRDIDNDLNNTAYRERSTAAIGNALVKQMEEVQPGRSFVVVPILLDNIYFGNLTLSHPAAYYFQDFNFLLAEGLADQLAGALYRIRALRALHEAEARLNDARLMSAIGEFSFGIAHRLGNDLGLVHTLVLRIREELTGRNLGSESIDAYLDSILESARGVLNLGEELKRAAASNRPDPEKFLTVSAGYLLQEAARSAPPLPAKIGIRFDLVEDIPPVRVTASRVIEVLRELIVNAVDAMPDGGVLTLRTRNDDGFVSCEVIDTGTGIPPNRLSKIFDLFYSTKAKNSGFGLWMARSVARGHGGDLIVESQPGAGSAFRLLLPHAVDAGTESYKDQPNPIVRAVPEHQREYHETVLRLAELSATVKDLKEKDEQRTRVLAMIAHELRQPLATTQIYVGNLARGIYGNLSAPQAESVKQLQQEVTTAIALTDKFLARQKVEAERLVFSPEPLYLSELIAYVVAKYRQEAERAQVRIVSDTTELIEVTADRLLLSQVLSNLVENALKFNRLEGSITITAVRSGSEATVSVEDTGIGISPEHAERIWEWEYQADNSLSRERGGIGYGLPIAKAYIDRHGGRMTLTSTPGRGSIFSFTLPVSRFPFAEEPI
ncbi:MAG TPA: ATP-binding protein [Thermoanaerobaculia bacterium]|nr:ATP-binding protein [Thermoanaerobaculia bacterium]